MILTASDLQELFMAGEEYRGRPICLSTDGSYLQRAAHAMPFVAAELLKARRQAEEDKREITRLRMQIHELHRLNAAGSP